MLEFDVYRVTPSFQNLQGEKVREIETGRPVILHFNVHNNLAEARSGAVVFEVRDSDDSTVYIGWQTMTIGPNGDYVMTVSWIPTSWIPSESDDYVIRAFAFNGIEGDVQPWSFVTESGRLFVNSD